MGAKQTEVTPHEYCREIEAYLCRKNDGHLIRIVGPSFERVCSWAEQGIPLKIACQGIDTCFVRYYAKGARRRPVQIDFCENDILDAFEAWRRAVGVRLPGTETPDGDVQTKRRTRSLPEHLDRVCERVTLRRAGMTPPPPEFDAVLETVTREAAAFRDLPGPLRGETRERIVARLLELDRMMLDAARAHVEPNAIHAMHAEATEQLRPFHDRMPADTYQRAIDSVVDRLLREREQLPTVAFE
ncbi:MAG TPA: hypothetical protein VM115_01300 [Vicinamibacterales bacterium]|nr:hypothetical protein [Vicinamibacterales bacterium]